MSTAGKADLPGYYLKNTVLMDYDESGVPTIRIEAERIDQIAHGNEVALYNIRVVYQAPSGPSWVMVGDVAHVQADGKVVDVTGNVRLQGEATGREGTAVVRTDTLTYDVADAVASTKSDVRIDFAQHTLTAHGFSANLKERTMRLESKVNGRFHP
jgi:LPS export ABC transporter protein LptC